MIRTLCRTVIRVSQPTEIDCWVAQGGLNRLEQRLATEIVDEVSGAHRVIADGKRLFSPLAERFRHFEAHDRAERLEPVVAAASIVAKDHRDSAMEDIAQRYENEFGPIAGGGYPNAATERFLRAYVRRYGVLPKEVRRSWRWHVLRELETRP